MAHDPVKEHAGLAAKHGEVLALLARDDDALHTRVPSVSDWSIAKQLDHVVRANGLMLGAVERIHADHEQALATTGSIKLIAKPILAFGRFPRGKGKAPKASQPPETVALDELRAEAAALGEQIERDRALLADVAARRGKFEHPLFGPLAGVEWLRLAHIHTSHHLRIVADIEKANAAG